jgi:DNA-binding LacI/PurR family transcriptional regulator
MTTSRPTINDVAARAGVSKSLVSLAIRGSDRVSEESREAILRAADELGYRPNAAARSLADRRSRTIGVLLHDLHNPVFAQVLDGVQEIVRARGYRTMLVTGHGDPERERAEVAALLDFQVEGLILISHRLDPQLAREAARECPVVIVMRHDITGRGISTVCADDVRAGREAVEQLVELGHERIAHISGGDNRVAADRAQGYREAMAAAGLADLVRVEPGDFTEAGGRIAATHLLATDPRITGLVVANDLSALGAVVAAQESGRRVPHDLSIVGFDGMSLAALGSLTLTTMAQPLEQMGREAAEQVFRRIESPRARTTHGQVVSAWLPRGTTSPMLASH